MFLWNCLAKNSRKFIRKMSTVEPFLIKLQDNVSKTGLRHRLFPRIFPILEQPFCRAHVSISSWPLDAFLVFNEEALLCSLFGTCHSQVHERTVTQKLPRNRAHRKCFFLEELHGCNLQLYFKKLFTTMALPSCLLCDWIKISFHNWSVAGGGFSDNLTNSICALSLIDEKK